MSNTFSVVTILSNSTNYSIHSWPKGPAVVDQVTTIITHGAASVAGSTNDVPVQTFTNSVDQKIRGLSTYVAPDSKKLIVLYVSQVEVVPIVKVTTVPLSTTIDLAYLNTVAASALTDIATFDGIVGGNLVNFTIQGNITQEMAANAVFRLGENSDTGNTFSIVTILSNSTNWPVSSWPNGPAVVSPPTTIITPGAPSVAENQDQIPVQLFTNSVGQKIRGLSAYISPDPTQLIILYVSQVETVSIVKVTVVPLSTTIDAALLNTIAQSSSLTFFAAFSGLVEGNQVNFVVSGSINPGRGTSATFMLS